MTWTVILPWPPAALQPHAKGHWRPKAKATAKYRRDAFWAAKEARLRGGMTAPTLRFTYQPPNRQRRDAQNMPGRLKAAIDGIADAMEVDDVGFQCVFPSSFADPVKGGKIIVEVSEDA